MPSAEHKKIGKGHALTKEVVPLADRSIQSV